MKYLLDTDHISIFQWEEGPSFDALDARLAAIPRAEVAISIVSVHEQFLGCHAFINKAKSSREVFRGHEILARVRAGLAWAMTLPFAEVFADLQAGRSRVATIDLRIAAIALSRNLILLTRNRADFARVLGLLIEDWTA